ncbi:transcription factor HEC1-like [Punica granatum]|uniref:BHLH domain-containing protein n=2 Tax=Punica granatum TaxID=22663 RepID=A0A218W0I7_PUNGR|nr:transcription factor HEC1-like [Punica granatum]OWM66265.1 hypothetical protein CDL15_Pgr013482 [Punica granatum]PKI50156.1 hypothetical protein CRG98_029480 [Punica granatum]
MESDNMMKLSPDDHMEVLTFLMQMEKLPEYIDSQPDSGNLSSLSPETAGISLDLSGNSALSPMFHSSSTYNGNGVPISEPAGASRQHAWSGAYASPPHCSGSRRGGSGSNAVGSMAEMREMIFRIAAMQPIYIDPEAVKPPKRRNVRISKDPQSVAARHRRERISERIRILQRLVPGGTKMDTASMLDEAIHYVKFLKRQVQTLEQASVHNKPNMVGGSSCLGFPVAHMNNSPNLL